MRGAWRPPTQPRAGLIGKHLVTWGIDPRRPDAGGVLIGLNTEDGSVSYEKAQGSSWSTRLFELHSNGAHVVPVWGFGIFAHDPATGERIWNIGGR